MKFTLYGINNLQPKLIKSGFNLPLSELSSEEDKNIRQNLRRGQKGSCKVIVVLDCKF